MNSNVFEPCPDCLWSCPVKGDCVFNEIPDCPYACTDCPHNFDCMNAHPGGCDTNSSNASRWKKAIIQDRIKKKEET